MHKGGIMQNSRLPFVLLFLGLALLSYQFLVHPTAKEQDFSKRFRVGFGDLAEDKSDSSFKASTHKFSKNHHDQIAGLAPVPAPAPQVDPSPSLSLAPSPAPANAPVDMKALAKATDDKAKADTKKKKKKKKTVSPNADPTAQTTAPAVAPVIASNSDVPPAPVVSPVAQDNTPSAGKVIGSTTAAKNSAMILYYETLLLKTPDSANTQKFVAAYKAKQIPDDVYFTVAAAMMADSRLQMKDLAVYTYGQVINIKSFEALVLILDTDSTNDIVKTDSQKYLTSYSDVTSAGGVAVLATALATSPSTPSLHIEALKLLDTAAKQFAQLEGAGTPSGNGQLNTLAYNPGSAQKLFVPFVSLLNNLVRTATDNNTKSIASQDLTDLQGLLGNESASINP